MYYLFPLILTRCEGPWPEPQPGQHPGLCELRHQLGVHPLRGRSVHGRDILHHHQGDSAQRGDSCLLWGRVRQEDQRGPLGEKIFI